MDLASKLLPGQTPLTCARCHKDVEPVLQERGDHIRADCPCCGKFIRFMKRRDTGILPTVLKLIPRLTHKERGEVLRILRSVPSPPSQLSGPS